MKPRLHSFSRRYQAALRAHLKGGRRQATLESARGLGSRALAAGLQTPDLARLHEQTLVTDVLLKCAPGQRASLIQQAGVFFAVAIAPAESTHPNAQEAVVHLNKFIETLSQRTVELAASNLELSVESKQREAAEAALKKCELHYSRLLAQSDRQQEQLRRLSRRVLSAQEDDRRKISRELRGVIAHTLAGINDRLATLKKEAAINTAGLDRSIARAQQLVEKSVDLVHRFALELRPAVLDDLGLIPALHSFMKQFTARTGVRTHLTAFAGVEELDPASRTALFRVAQEALTNVARHAKASRVDVTIQKLPDCICMKIKDNGKSFKAERVMRSRSRTHLGLLGMRERLEMIGGRFSLESEPGKGTVVKAQIALANNGMRGARQPVKHSNRHPE